jgi:Na+/phosphate symporter
MSTRALSQDDLSERDSALADCATATEAISDLIERMLRREDADRAHKLRLAYFASKRASELVGQAFG